MISDHLYDFHIPLRYIYIHTVSVLLLVGGVVEVGVCFGLGVVLGLFLGFGVVGVWGAVVRGELRGVPSSSATDDDILSTENCHGPPLELVSPHNLQ